MGFKGEHSTGIHDGKVTQSRSFTSGSADIVPPRTPVVSLQRVPDGRHAIPERRMLASTDVPQGSANPVDSTTISAPVTESSTTAYEAAAATPGIRNIHRGAWVDTLVEGDKVPVGGSIFDDTFDITVTVDTEWMAEKMDKFTPENVGEAFAENRENFEGLVEKYGVPIDPELYHTLYQVQRGSDKLLQIGDDPVKRQRAEAYDSGNAVLSDLVGKSECAERAVVGKMLLDRVGIPSTMMGGIVVDSKEVEPLEHAYLLLDDPQGDGTLFFDIGRPWKQLNGYPRVGRSERKITYEDFAGKDNYVVPANDILTGQTIYYGVGNPSIMQDIHFADI